MSDYDSSLPVRTEAAGDIDIFISDATISTQKLKVNADGSIDTNTSIAAGAKVIVTDGTDDLEINADGSVNAVVTATDLDIRPLVNTDVVTIEDGGGSITVDGTVAATQSGTWDIGTVTTLTGIANDVNIADGGNSITVDAVDLNIRDLAAATDSVQANLFDGSGVAFSAANPLPVELASDEQGDEIVDYHTTAAIAAAASTNHDYTVTALKTFIGKLAFISGSGKIKVEMLIDATPIFTGFNSTSNPNIEIPLEKMVKASAASVIRFTITNRDKQPQDVYSTLTGVEV